MIQQEQKNDQLTIILQNALHVDLNIRNQAEEEIKKLFNNNYGQFLIELSKKISYESEKKRSTPN